MRGVNLHTLALEMRLRGTTTSSLEAISTEEGGTTLDNCLVVSDVVNGFSGAHATVLAR